jgi:glyoxylase-like metal-dependent hydrolase (beta-lactamase superfamily II)
MADICESALMNLAPSETRFEVAPKIGLFHEAAADIAALRTVMVNVVFVGVPGTSHWVLVDAGLFGSAKRIRAAAELRFGPGARPAAIILTHGHFDHVGAIGELSESWDVPVYAHPLELPYLTGRSSYPPPDPTVGGGAMAWLASAYPKRPIDLGPRVHALPHDGVVPELPGWRWIHTPGHTAGHVALFRESDRALISGDAVITTRQESALAVLEQRPELNGPPAYFTPDWQSARDSLQHLASLHPSVLVTGHGVPVRGDNMQEELQRLARDFDLLAVPEKGRYVPVPAVTNQHGVVSVPPRRWGKGAFALAAVATVGAIGLIAAIARADEEL